jgi:hypothetical protein
MLTAEYNSNPFTDVARLSNHELLEVHHSKISIHHAKAGYDYPAIRLPFTFSGLIGLLTRIYQTVHDEHLRFWWLCHQLAPPQKAELIRVKMQVQAANPPSSHVDNNLI